MAAGLPPALLHLVKVPIPKPSDPVLRVARGLASLATLWHRARLHGVEHLPDGPALLVGNHGLMGFETPVFFYLLHQATGRFPVGLADKNVFGKPPMKSLLERVGGVTGTPDNARALLRGGQLVVCYPGGSREVFKPRDAKYRLQWERAVGFARIAVEEQVPIVPFAGLGVDDTYLHFGHVEAMRSLLGRYTVPLAMGLGPLPLPTQLRFRLGRPIEPPKNHARVHELKAAAQAAVERMLRADDTEETVAEIAFDTAPCLP